MKKILFAALVLISLASCSKTTTEEVLVRFQNTMDEDITTARYEFGESNQFDLGVIPANTTTEYQPFDYFQTGDGLPMGVLHGLVGGTELWASSGLWCGTGVEFSQLEPGKYTLVITKYSSNDEVFYQLKFAE
jgi:hypothetical protein